MTSPGSPTSAIGFVFARGGSKGVPGKNLRPLGGRPLIAHAVQTALASRHLTRVVVSTDDPAIAEAARQAGAEVPFLRPAELAQDASPEWLAWRHAIAEIERRDGRAFDAFVSVPTTSPLRAPTDIDACIERFGVGDCDVVVTVSPAHRSPYFNMVTLDPQGLARLVIPPEHAIATRQTAPKVYDMTTVCYVARPSFVMTANGLFEGRVAAVNVPAERALDIDTELDLTIAEALYARRTPQ